MKCCYLIYCKDLDIKEIYIGHTVDFDRRKGEHLSRCNDIKSKEYNLKRYKFIRENGGFDNWEFTILEEDCEKIRERFWYEHFDYLPQLNKQYPGRTKKEWEQTDERKQYEQSDERKQYLKEHQKKNNNVISTCSICGNIYKLKTSLRRHIRENHE
tara:strand:+ start:283 stop:750 length:468 start_codon:yes stop_codon:yes gene_type:complete